MTDLSPLPEAPFRRTLPLPRRKEQSLARGTRLAGPDALRWSRLFGQLFRFDEWSLCRG